jgi:hypothetical protein
MTRFLDPKDMAEAILEVAEMARHAQTRVVLIGGAAMVLYGSDRMTMDVDFASREYLPELTIVRSLSFGGYAGLSRSGHPVDIIIRCDEYAPLYEEAIDHAVDAGLPVPVVDPDHLAALKMAAGREKDELDLKTLIRLGVLNHHKTRRIVKTHLGEYAARTLDSLCEEVAWLKSREK